MVVIILPKWVGEAEKQLKDIIMKIAHKNNINYKFVNDSQSINDSVFNVLNVLLRIQQESKSIIVKVTENKPKVPAKPIKKIIPRKSKADLSDNVSIPSAKVSDLYSMDEKKEEVKE